MNQNVVPRRDYSSLGFKPGEYDPIQFPITIELGNAVGDSETGQINCRDNPFIVEFLTHQIVSPYDVTATGFQYNEIQHGLYTINWSLYNQDRYWAGDPPMADAAYGSVRHGIWIPFRAPLALEANRTIEVELTNMALQRTDYKVQVIFHGIEDKRPGARGIV